MNNIKKAILASAILFSSASAMAEMKAEKINKEWQVNDLGAAIVVSHDFEIFAIYNGYSLSFSDKEKKCLISDQGKKYKSQMVVNGKRIKAITSCHNQDVYFKAETDEGIDYVFRQFVGTGTVILNGSKITTYKFIETATEVDDQAEAI
jgi:hypothetical protein